MNVLPGAISEWGLFPSLLGISSYSIFSLIALLAGAACFLFRARRTGIGLESAAATLLCILVGAGAGARLPFLLLGWNDLESAASALFLGKTMLGGIVGGLLSAVLAKRLFRVQGALGDVAAPPLALALAIGRVGCLGAGCCYGKAALWGIDLGDGIARWPTQLFESVFHFLAFALLLVFSRKHAAHGRLFSCYLAAYLLFRYFTEFLREGTPVWAGQTGYQLFCIGGLLMLAACTFFPAVRQNKGGFLS